MPKGDYAEYDIELDSGKDFSGEVKASGLVNIYLLDEDNLDNLDQGEEFWSETGEEGVENARLEFTAPSKGNGSSSWKMQMTSCLRECKDPEENSFHGASIGMDTPPASEIGSFQGFCEQLLLSTAILKLNPWKIINPDQKETGTTEVQIWEKHCRLFFSSL